MKALELNPLSKEKIDELKIDPHQLWIVRIDETIYGPYEGKTLKAYAEKNQDMFNHAESTRIDTQDWQPFFSHALFQRRNPQIIKNEPKNFNGPFWILNDGMKVGPIEKRDIIKSLELGTLTLIDLISIDEGHHWIKVFEIPELDRRYFSIDDLPASPADAEFNEARIKILEKIENEQPVIKISEELAALTYQAEKSENVIILNTEIIPLQREQDPLIGQELKIKLGLLAASFFGLVFVFHLFFQSPEDHKLVEDNNFDSKDTFSADSNFQSNQARNYGKLSSKVRRPASLPKLAPISTDTSFNESPAYSEDTPVENNPPPEDTHHQEVSQYHEAPQENNDVAAVDSHQESTSSDHRSPATQSEENLVPPEPAKTVEDVMSGGDNSMQEPTNM